MKSGAGSPGAQAEEGNTGGGGGGGRSGSPPMPPTTQQGPGTSSNGNSPSSGGGATQQPSSHPIVGKGGGGSGSPSGTIEESTTPLGPFPLLLERRAHSVAILPSASHDPIGSPPMAMTTAAASTSSPDGEAATHELPPVVIKRHASQSALPSSLPVLLVPTHHHPAPGSGAPEGEAAGGRNGSVASELSVSVAASAIDASQPAQQQPAEQQQPQRKGSRLRRRGRGRNGRKDDGRVGGSVGSSITSALGASSYPCEDGMGLASGAGGAGVGAAAVAEEGRHAVVAEIPTPADPKDYELMGE